MVNTVIQVLVAGEEDVDSNMNSVHFSLRHEAECSRPWADAATRRSVHHCVKPQDHTATEPLLKSHSSAK